MIKTIEEVCVTVITFIIFIGVLTFGLLINKPNRRYYNNGKDTNKRR